MTVCVMDTEVPTDHTLVRCNVTGICACDLSTSCCYDFYINFTTYHSLISSLLVIGYVTWLASSRAQILKIRPARRESPAPMPCIRPELVAAAVTLVPTASCVPQWVTTGLLSKIACKARWAYRTENTEQRYNQMRARWTVDFQYDSGAAIDFNVSQKTCWVRLRAKRDGRIV